MRDSRWIEQHAAEWLARRESDDWNPRDQQELEQWLSASTRHRVAYLRLQSAWQEADRLRVLSNGISDGIVTARHAWAAPASDAERQGDAQGVARRRRARLSRLRARRAEGWRKALLATVVAVAFTIFAWTGWNHSGLEKATFSSRTGELKTIVLADGTSATLSSATEFEVLMTRGSRAISLVRGEAFFDVAHDPGRPFVVAANAHRVVAVGTRFSVRRDPTALRVVVTEGKVRLESPSDSDGRSGPSTLLPAGSVASAGPNGVLVRSLPLVEAERYLEWRSGFVAFDDTVLMDAVSEFNRYNLRKIELGDSGVAKLRIGGNFRWDNSEGFVSLLELGFPIRVERLPDRIVLHSL